MKKPVFSKRDLPLWKVPVRLYWDLLTSGRYQPACHYVYKKWKNPSSALRRKEEKDVSTGPSMIFDLFPRFRGLGHRSYITYSGPSPISQLRLQSMFWVSRPLVMCFSTVWELHMFFAGKSVKAPCLCRLEIVFFVFRMDCVFCFCTENGDWMCFCMKGFCSISWAWTRSTNHHCWWWWWCGESLHKNVWRLVNSHPIIKELWAFIFPGYLPIWGGRILRENGCLVMIFAWGLFVCFYMCACREIGNERVSWANWFGSDGCSKKRDGAVAAIAAAHRSVDGGVVAAMGKGKGGGSKLSITSRRHLWHFSPISDCASFLDSLFGCCCVSFLSGISSFLVSCSRCFTGEDGQDPCLWVWSRPRVSSRSYSFHPGVIPSFLHTFKVCKC